MITFKGLKFVENNGQMQLLGHNQEGDKQKTPAIA